MRKLFENFFIALLFLYVSAFALGIKVRYNISESLPYSFFLSYPKGILLRGQIVAFQHPMSTVTFAKLIAGVPGDRISINENSLFINDQEKAKISVNLIPIEEGTIPTGYYFVMGTDPKSFDSRYLEFGLIPESSIKEALWPIF